MTVNEVESARHAGRTTVAHGRESNEVSLLTAEREIHDLAHRRRREHASIQGILDRLEKPEHGVEQARVHARYSERRTASPVVRRLYLTFLFHLEHDLLDSARIHLQPQREVRLGTRRFDDPRRYWHVRTDDQVVERVVAKRAIPERRGLRALADDADGRRVHRWIRLRRTRASEACEARPRIRPAAFDGRRSQTLEQPHETISLLGGRRSNVAGGHRRSLSGVGHRSQAESQDRARRTQDRDSRTALWGNSIGLVAGIARTVKRRRKMQTRKLGRSGLRVSAIGLGCMGMSEFYGASDEVRVAGHAGARSRHRRDVLGHGRHVRQWPEREAAGEGARSRGAPRSRWPRSSATCAVPEAAFIGISGRPEYVRTACEASLERLGVEQIDLYYQHRVDPTSRSKRRSARWPSWSARGRCGTWVCRRRRRRRFAGGGRAPDRRAADRVLAVDAGRREARSSHDSRARDLARGV